MIISYKHRFIFIKTKKTASSSIENYLANYLGLDDILIGGKQDGTPSLNPVIKDRHRGWRWISSTFEKEWQQFFTFCVVRNPWDVMVSAYFFLKATDQIQKKFDTFDKWIKHDDIAKMNDWSLYANDDGPVVDAVLRYENLEHDLMSAPIPYCGELQTIWKKTGYRPRGHYRDFYDTQSRYRVAEIYGLCIDYFQYQF